MDLDDHIRLGARSTTLTIQGERVDIEHLMDEGHRRVEQVVARGATRVVAAVLSNDVESAGLVLGAISAHVPLVSLPSRPSGQPAQAYAETLDDLLAVCGDALVLGLSEEEHRALRTDRTEAGAADPFGPDEGFSLVQFTSGTTGAQAGVVVPAASLLASIEAMLDRVDARPGDGTCSWLPLGHDMGLVGMFLTPLAAGSSQLLGDMSCDLMTPMDFLRKPARWLERIQHTGATITATPDSALRHLLRTTQKGIAGIDLGHVKALIAGGEVNRPETMAAVTTFLTELGAGAGALCPGYGMAEAGLAVAISPPGAGYEVATAPLPGETDEHRWVTAGPPLTGYEIEPTADEGRLRVAGPGLANAYLDGSRILDDQGFYETSDIGALADSGSVVVMGRVDDTLVLNGRNVPAGSVDHALHDAAGVRANRAYACMLTDGSWAVVAEVRTASSDSLTPVLQELRRRATAETGSSPDVVVAARPSTIPFTSSGKLQRAKLGRLVSAGGLAELGRI